MNEITIFNMKNPSIGTNHFGRVEFILGGYKLFLAGTNYFGQVQIIKICSEKSNLDLVPVQIIPKDLDGDL